MLNEAFKIVFILLLLSSNIKIFTLLVTSKFIYILPKSWKISILPEIGDFACGKKYLCNQTKRYYECAQDNWTCSRCSCKTSCFQYGTCCLDMFATAGKIPFVPHKIKCLSSALKHSRNVITPNYSMITGCPQSTTSNVSTKSLCESRNPSDISLNTPVQVIANNTELTFRNKYCAHCYGIKSDAIVEWRKDYQCSGVIPFNQVRTIEDFQIFAQSSDSCAVMFKPEDSFRVEPCSDILQGNDETYITRYVSTCSEGDSFIRHACANVYSPVKIKSGTDVVLYKNVFCAICNGTTFYRQRICKAKGRLKSIRVVPLSSLFRFSDSYQITDNTRDKVYCKEDEVFDIFNSQCRLIFCPMGMLIQNHSCVDVVKSASGIGYRLLYRLNPTRHVKVLTRDEGSFAIINSYLIYLNKFFATLGISAVENSIRYKYRIIDMFQEIEYIIVYTKLIISNHSPRKLVEMKLREIQETPYHWYLNNEPETYEIFERQPHLIDENVHFPTATWPLKVKQLDTVTLTQHQRYGSLLVLPRAYMGSDTSYRLVNNLLSCPMISLNKTEYSFYSNKSILILSTQRILHPGSFRLYNNSVYVCTEFKGYKVTSENKTVTINYLEFTLDEVILTVICISLSLAGLFMTVVTYILLPQLRTFPGINNMALFTTMFVAYLLFITTISANVNKSTCSFFGILNHYFLLAMFFWKNVCAIHMFRVFCYPFKYINRTKWFILYLIYSHGCPFIIVLLYVLVHLGQSKWNNIGYGDHICFITIPVSLGIGFALPVGLVLLTNFVFFVFIIKSINKSTNQVKNNTERTNILNVSVYFRMSIILGFTWFLGFASMWSKSQMLRYAFTILNSLVGVFVFSSYVLKRDVLTKLRIKFCGYPRDQSNMTDNTYSGELSGKKENIVQESYL